MLTIRHGAEVVPSQRYSGHSTSPQIGCQLDREGLIGCACTQAMLDTGIPLISAYAARLGHEPPITNNTASFRGTLDYIWLAGAGDFSVASVLEMPYADSALKPDDVRLAPMPDETFPSDHLAIAAKLHVHARTPGEAAM